MKDKDYNITEDQDYISAVSSTDCTGLIPSGTVNEMCIRDRSVTAHGVGEMPIG